MSDGQKAVRVFEREYTEGAGSFDMQRPVDRGLPPTARLDPDANFSFREKGKRRGPIMRCASCEAETEIHREDLEKWFDAKGHHVQWREDMADQFDQDDDQDTDDEEE